MLELTRSVAAHSSLGALLRAAPAAALRLQGDALIPGALQGAVAYDIGGQLSARWDKGVRLFPLDAPEASLELTPVGAAADAPLARVVDGRALYANVFPGTSAVLGLAHNALDQTLLIREAQSPDLFVWRSALGPGLRATALDNNETAIVDAAGNVRLTVRAVRVVDAKGVESTALLKFDADGFARLALDQSRLQLPALVHLRIDAPRLGLLAPAAAVVKGRVLVVLDTSGSMLLHFGDDTSAHGDGDATAVFCDNALGGGSPFTCSQKVACTVANGGVPYWPVDDSDDPSRLLAAKRAMQNVIIAHSGLLDFGLERFAAHASCANDQFCCTPQVNGTTAGRCKPVDNYTDLPSSASSDDLTFEGACGTTNDGGDILVPPAPSSSTDFLRWIDFVEDFCSSTDSVGGPPRNPEIRGSGPTPLATSVTTARRSWYKPIYDVSKPGAPGFNPSDPLHDPYLDCRAYALVVMTDGVNNCERDPSNEVGQLTSTNAANPVHTYVLGVGQKSGLDTAELNQMAVAGLTGPVAPVATSQQEIEAVFADVVASTVKFEVCNAADDNCNARVDEGLGVYQDCTLAAQCASGNCDQGRCKCASDTDCADNFTCAADDFCRPICSVVNKACKNFGVKKCGAAAGECCADNGNATCDEILDLPEITEEICNERDDDCDGAIDEGLDCGTCNPLPEVCDGDDNDCDELIDAADPNLVGVGGPCGLSVGACEQGTVECVAATLTCEGAKGPYTEVCNGLDDDCDGVSDGTSRPCYTLGLSDPTRNVGVCHDGAEACLAPPGEPGVECSDASCWGECVGDATPTAEICDGRDNDCNGLTDDGIPFDPLDPESPLTGDECCPFQAEGVDLCGVGVCEFGAYACSGTRVVCAAGQGPSGEICDGKDNDCNGAVDDVAGAGVECTTASSCAGTLQCDVSLGLLVCDPIETTDPELCNGLDDDCDEAVDEMPDVDEDDPTIGVACDVPMAPNDEKPCKAGKTVCFNAKAVCDGAVGPNKELCNNLDDNCDGVPDDNAECPAETACIEGECVRVCLGGEFPCPGGYECINGFCRQKDGAVGGTGGLGGEAGTGIGGGGGQGGDGVGGDGGSAGSGPDAGATGGNDERDFYGLATGGGGCACALDKTSAANGWSSCVGLLLLCGWRRYSGRRSPAQRAK